MPQKKHPVWQYTDRRGKKMATEGRQAKASANEQPVSLWAAALNQLKEWDLVWAEHTVKMTTNPWMDGILPVKFIELVSIGLNASRTNLNPEGTRRHIRAGLAAGASRQEILFVLKCASVMSIHSFSFNAPLLIQEASMGSLEDFRDSRKKQLERLGKATPAVEKMKAIGHWSEEWDSILFLDPVWTEQYMGMCTSLYAENVLPPKELELLLVAFDAAYVHIYGPGTRRHIKNAFKAGATVEEIMEVLKLGVVQGVQACNLGVTLLAEELERDAAA